MEDQFFLEPRFKGVRFDNHGLPLDILKDIAVLDEMVKAVAKSCYLKEHSDRKRVPRNFMDDISLQITALEPGSTIVKIAVVASCASTLFSSVSNEYALKAKECILSTIDAVEMSTDGNFLGDNLMSKSQLAMFDRLGRTLNDDECIELGRISSGKIIKLDKQIRKKLLKASSNADHYSEAVVIYGTVHEMDQDKKTFTITSVDGTKISVQKFNLELYDDIIAAFSSYSQGQRILLKGVGQFERNGRLSIIENVDTVELLSPTDVGYRISEIMVLKDSWYNGHGKAFSRAQLQNFLHCFKQGYVLEEDPYIFPALDNIIQLEWKSETWRFSAEIKLDDLTAEFYAFDTNSDSEFSRILDFSKQDSWDALKEYIEKPQEYIL